MKATFISRDKNTVKFTMEFTAEEFEQAQIKVYQEAKNQFEIPGFRKARLREALSKSTTAKAFSSKMQSTHCSDSPTAMHWLTLTLKSLTVLQLNSAKSPRAKDLPLQSR